MITIERHIAEQENLHKDATGMFSRLIRDLTLSIRIISREVRRAGLNDILGMTGTENIHGESVKNLMSLLITQLFKQCNMVGMFVF